MTEQTTQASSQSNTPGYWQDPKGNLVPVSRIKQIDQLRDQIVYELCAKAETESRALSTFKINAMADVAAYISTSAENYGVKTGGEKGNVSLPSYDGKYKIVRQMQDKIVFGEQILSAKQLIDECVHVWAAGANDNIRVLVNHAFQTDKEGKINIDRVLGLRALDIKDPKWLQAMQAIADSMQTASTKPYIRFYKRDEATQEYLPINLDVAGA